MLHDDMNLSRLMVYEQSIEDSKLRRVARILKRSGASDQEQPRFKKREQSQEESRSAKFKIEKGGGSKNGKFTCITYGKKHYGECLLGTGSFYGCGKEGNKVRDCPNIASRGKEGKQVAPSVPNDDTPTKRHFYTLWTRGEKSNGDDDEEGKSYFSILVI